jgi:hypothetical protein
MHLMTRSAATSSAQHRAVRQPSTVSQPAPARQAFQVSFATLEEEAAHYDRLAADARARKAELEEKARLEEEARLAEEARKAEEARLAAAEAEEAKEAEMMHTTNDKQKKSRSAKAKTKLAAAEKERREAAKAAAGQKKGMFTLRKQIKAVGITGQRLEKLLSEIQYMRSDVVEADDEEEIPTTYTGTGMGERLEEIMELVDELGVISAPEVSKRVLGKGGKKWEGNPVRQQLMKLVRQGHLQSASCKVPQMSGGIVKRSPTIIYARTDAALMAYKLKMEEDRNPKQ